jgi:hypothetical protein
MCKYRPKRRLGSRESVMAFAMRDEWKDEPESITGAEYVEPWWQRS